MDMEIYEKGKEIFNYLKENFKVYTVEECKQLEKDEGAYGVIYITQCKVNGKLYIGQKMINRNEFATYLGSGKAFKRALKKYGKDNFDRIILEVSYSKEELDKFEIKYIELFEASEKDNNLFYNIALGGQSGGLIGRCHSEETRKKMSEINKGENNPSYIGFVVVYPNGEVSKEMSQLEVADYLNISTAVITKLAREKSCYIGTHEDIRYIRILHLEDYLKEIEDKSNEEFINMCKQMVEEAKILYKKKREEVSEVFKQLRKTNPINMSEETRRKLSEAGKGRHHSEETRKKISEARKGKKATEETRKKLSEAQKRNNGSAKLVVCIFPDGRVIKDVCMKELAEELGIHKDLVKKILKSKKPYKATHAPNKSYLEHLKSLEGIIIMYQEDYLNVGENNPSYDNGDKVRGIKNSQAKIVVCIFPDGRVIKDVCMKELAEELGMSQILIRKILRSKKPYKAQNRGNLKQLDRIIIMSQEDYLKGYLNSNINKINGKAS